MHTPHFITQNSSKLCTQELTSNEISHLECFTRDTFNWSCHFLSYDWVAVKNIVTIGIVGATVSVHTKAPEIYLLSLLSHPCKINTERKGKSHFNIIIKIVLIPRILWKCHVASRACRLHFGNYWSKYSKRLIIKLEGRSTGVHCTRLYIFLLFSIFIIKYWGREVYVWKKKKEKKTLLARYVFPKLKGEITILGLLCSGSGFPD